MDMKKYWNDRYISGGNSGDGSYGEQAIIKANYVNNIIDKYNIHSVVDMGVGDGNQLDLLNINNYIGYDISDVIINRLKLKYNNDNTKTFKHVSEYTNMNTDLMLSMEVIFHLIDDDMYDDYMTMMFNSDSKYILIFTMDSDSSYINNAKHVKIRNILEWINNNTNEWDLIDKKFGFSISYFYLYKKK